MSQLAEGLANPVAMGVSGADGLLEFVLSLRARGKIFDPKASRDLVVEFYSFISTWAEIGNG